MFKSNKLEIEHPRIPMSFRVYYSTLQTIVVENHKVLKAPLVVKTEEGKIKHYSVTIMQRGTIYNLHVTT